MFVLITVSCEPWSGRSFKPGLPGYKDSRKTALVLDGELKEISGQVNLSHSTFAAINDEDGVIIRFDLSNSQMTQSTRFGKKGDYEDIARVDSVYYVMESNGDLHEVTPHEKTSTQYKFELEKKIEFESLVYYEKFQKLVLITKDHALDLQAIFSYSFDLKTKQFDAEPFFTIQLDEVLRKMKDLSAEFKPSAAALHPITGELYILASVGKSLLICTPEGTVKAAYDLNPDQFQQPEGISFAPNGDMFISNEGLHGKGTFIIYPYSSSNPKNITKP
ncbi:MAG: hypothetical protein ACXWCT_13080 [Flavitalea sp.]